MSIRTPIGCVGAVLFILVNGQGCSSRSGHLREELRPEPVVEKWAPTDDASPSSPSAPGAPAELVEGIVDQVDATDEVVWASEPLTPFTDVVEPAPTPETTGVTLAELEATALANNPALRQLEAQAYKAAGVRDQVGLYPNPTVGYMGQQIADAGTDQHSVFIEQEIVNGDKLWLNEQVLSAASRAQFQELNIQRQKVLTDVRVRFYEALGAQRKYELASEFEQVAAQGVEVATDRMEALVGTRAELLQAEIMLDQVQLIRQQAEIEMQGAWADLTAISGVANWTNPGLVGELEIAAAEQDWDAREAMLIASSPELSAALARVSAARANVERQEAQPVPNLMLNASSGYDNSTNEGMINLEVGAPIPVYNGNEGNIRAAYGEYCSATHDVRRIEMSLRSRLARTAQEYDSALVAVQRYDKSIVPRAQQTLQLSEEAYRIGESGFLEVLVIRRTAFDANLLYVESLTKLAQASSQLDGLLLTGGLDEPSEFTWDDGLRGQSLGGQ